MSENSPKLIPSREQVEAMLALVAPGADFFSLSPDDRVKVLDLVLKAEHSVMLNEIDKTLQNIASDMEELGKWFRLSRVYEGN